MVSAIPPLKIIKGGIEFTHLVEREIICSSITFFFLEFVTTHNVGFDCGEREKEQKI